MISVSSSQRGCYQLRVEEDWYSVTRVPELCRELGLGERSCQRIFAATLGMPPKSFARLTRFLHACSQLQRGHWTHLTHLAHDCGYYDQAHFIADCRAFSGMTPSHLAAARGFSFLEIG